MSNSDETTEAERLEALSKLYVDAARVVLVASGRYVVFSMARGDIIATVDTGGLPEAIAAACERSSAAWELSQRERLGADSTPLDKTADALGL